MKPLILLLLTGGVSAGVTAWQQQSIHRMRIAIAGLSEQIVQTRSIRDAEQASLAVGRARLKQLQVELKASKAERAAVAGTAAPLLPTPTQEGWWPEDRPYFYLAKTYLSNVRFRGRPLRADEELSDESKAQFAQNKASDYRLDYQLFNGAELNPHMAVLLGMSDEEVVALNDIYATFLRNLRDLEVSRIQWLEPPEPAGDFDRKVVARLPALRSELQPLLDDWRQGLDQILGASRAEILQGQAEDFFNERLDRLGESPREFLRDNGRLSLWIRYTEPWGQHLGATTFNLEWNRSANGQDWQYGHLFGPGAPGELK